jgi:hypothetical protein
MQPGRAGACDPDAAAGSHAAAGANPLALTNILGLAASGSRAAAEAILSALNDTGMLLLNFAKRANGMYRRGDFDQAAEEYLLVRGKQNLAK